VGSVDGSGPYLVQTVDFITPVADDPFVYGAVAAANALSDIYAMGGVPRFALNIVAFPTARAPLEVLGRILDGGAAKALEAGIPIVGGHSICDREPKYGLVVTGEVSAERLATNRGARPGDLLVLTKPLGTGLLVGALRAEALPEGDTAALYESMMALNRAAAEEMARVGVHAATDVTGFGLLGHAMQMMRASGVAAQIDLDALPLLPGARALAAKAGIKGAAQRNWDYVERSISSRGDDALTRVAVDPQTSGGLLIAVSAARATALLDALGASSVGAARIIGRVVDGQPGTMALVSR
jgi:selenide,water dikinase